MNDSIVKMMETLGVGENAGVGIIQNVNNIMQQINRGKSPAEIAESDEITNKAMIGIANIFNRMNIPLETKLVTDNEFIFYKFADDKDLCPKLREWERKEGKFLIKYKKHESIDLSTKDKKIEKDLIVVLVNKLHDANIFHCNLTKDNIVYNEYEGIKLTGFTNSLWIDQISEDYLLNNSYGKPCSNIKELLELEINMINKITHVYF